MSQGVEISSENVVDVEVGSQEIESVKTNKNADIIQIPVELESEAVSETGGDVSVAEDDRTLEQVADIAVDVNQEPASKQSIHR
uniref:Uncharacterized protein n=1 Tax=Romanomermis culicivorax TaxID=13658 RepID=A0A915JQ93_ROMCU